MARVLAPSIHVCHAAVSATGSGCNCTLHDTAALASASNLLHGSITFTTSSLQCHPGHYCLNYHEVLLLLCLLPSGADNIAPSAPCTSNLTNQTQILCPQPFVMLSTIHHQHMQDASITVHLLALISLLLLLLRLPDMHQPTRLLLLPSTTLPEQCHRL